MSDENGNPPVTFAVPPAGVGVVGHAPNEPAQPVAAGQGTEPPPYAVVIHEGREVLYKRIGA